MKTSITLADATSWLELFSQEMEQKKSYLTELDSAIGDADHGINMSRGMAAAVAKIHDSSPATLGDLFKSVGMALVTTVGGASGPLYGTFFLRIGVTLGDAAEATAAQFAQALHAAEQGVVARGKAELGDKTMIDAIHPAVAAFAAADAQDVAAAAKAAALAAEEGSSATAALVARKGRASYLGERSAGHIDPGSASSAILFACLRDTLDGAA